MGHEIGDAWGNVGGERLGELGPVEEQEPVDGRQDRGTGRTRRRVGDQGVDRLTLVGCEGGDVHERDDAVVGAGFGDDGTAVGVADQHDRTRLLVEHASGGGNVTDERQGLVLHDVNVDALAGEYVVHPLPAGAVHEAPVDEHDAR